MSSVAWVLLMLLCVSCSPWSFTVQRDTDWPLTGRIIKRHDMVEVDAANAFTVAYPSRVALRCDDVTDGIFDAEILTDYLPTDTSVIVSLLMRSTPYADTVLKVRSPVEMHISTTHTRVLLPDSTITVVAPLPPPGTPFRVQVYTMGRTLRVSVACHDVGIFDVQAPSSEWITVAPAVGQSVRIIDPVILPVGYADRWQTR
jgi:hypothetical protein